MQHLDHDLGLDSTKVAYLSLELVDRVARVTIILEQNLDLLEGIW
jgi:hypothetical protein